MSRVKIHFDLDFSYDPPVPVSFSHYEIKAANEMVEEYMLLANMSVARELYKHFPEATLLRNHPPPHGYKLDDFIEVRSIGGMTL